MCRPPMVPSCLESRGPAMVPAAPAVVIQRASCLGIIPRGLVTRQQWIRGEKTLEAVAIIKSYVLGAGPGMPASCRRLGTSELGCGLWQCCSSLPRGLVGSGSVPGSLSSDLRLCWSCRLAAATWSCREKVYLPRRHNVCTRHFAAVREERSNEVAARTQSTLSRQPMECQECEWEPMARPI